jgi:hypothetical protein
VDIEVRQAGPKWIAEVWAGPVDDQAFKEGIYEEDKYVEINDWCKATLKYHARTAYHIFEFKSKKDLEWFILRWQ